MNDVSLLGSLRLIIECGVTTLGVLNLYIWVIIISQHKARCINASVPLRRVSKILLCLIIV